MHPVQKVFNLLSVEYWNSVIHTYTYRFVCVYVGWLYGWVSFFFLFAMICIHGNIKKWLECFLLYFILIDYPLSATNTTNHKHHMNNWRIDLWCVAMCMCVCERMLVPVPVPVPSSRRFFLTESRPQRRIKVDVDDDTICTISQKLISYCHRSLLLCRHILYSIFLIIF